MVIIKGLENRGVDRSLRVRLCMQARRLWMSRLNQYSHSKTTLFQIYIMQRWSQTKHKWAM